LSVRPDLWDRELTQHLLAPTMELLAQWDTRLAGLFTFAHSAKHVGLYQKFGFWPRHLTAIMAKPCVQQRSRPPAGRASPGWTRTIAPQPSSPART
jgi:hypothetical protein